MCISIRGFGVSSSAMHSPGPTVLGSAGRTPPLPPDNTLRTAFYS
jgi:hypothetical protein